MGECTECIQQSRCSLTRTTQPLCWEAASLRGWWAEGAEAVTASPKPIYSALVRMEKVKEMP